MSLEQFRDPQLETSGERIGFYEREFYVFSNFSSFQIYWRDYLWPTSEHLYHFFKFPESSVPASLIRTARSAHDAFKIAHEYKNQVRSDWNDVKVGIMEEICRAKLQQHEYIQKKLLQTGDMELVEDSPKDNFWGWGKDRTGRNELGKIWMKLRKELNDQS